MAEIIWGAPGQKVYETGVDRGVLYLPNALGEYTDGVPWNGLTSIEEAPSGAEATKHYADNSVYANMISAEEFGGTIEAFTYPDEFAVCDGTAVVNGVEVSQQRRRGFALAYRTLIGNDLDGIDFGYKLHLIYGCMAAPASRSRATVNESPEPMTLSWELTTTPVAVGTIGGVYYRPTAKLTIDSTRPENAEGLVELEASLYGTALLEPELPSPAEVIALFAP